MTYDKLKETDKCVYFLAEHDGWYPAYKIKGVPFHDTFIGSEADTRLYEVFNKAIDRTGALQETQWEIDGAKFTVQTKKDRGIRVYRATQTAFKTLKKVIYDEETHTAKLVEVKI